MAAKTSLRVGQKVSFGDSTHPVCRGTVKKLNPKTARITVPGKGTFDVHYRNIKNSKKAAGRPTARKAKSKRKPAMTAAKRAAAMRALDKAWDTHEARYGHDSRMYYGNPSKRKRAKRKLPARKANGQFKKTARKRRR